MLFQDLAIGQSLSLEMVWENTKYNLDAIVHIFRLNIRNYVENEKSGIAWSYEEVGRMFPCGYEIR